MKNLLFSLIIGLLLSACSNFGSYEPTKSLTTAQQDSFKYEISRYIGHMPKRAKLNTRFAAEFDGDYQQAAKNHQLDKYYENPKDGYTYFEVSRIAPSLHEKYVATGGRLKRDDQGKIIDYEEIYRTWKMERTDLEKKTVIFFDKMVKGEDLSSYQTANIGDTEHIEFPDHQTYFNKENRRWEMTTKDNVN